MHTGFPFSHASDEVEEGIAWLGVITKLTSNTSFEEERLTGNVGIPSR